MFRTLSSDDATFAPPKDRFRTLSPARSPSKSGQFLPGGSAPILNESPITKSVSLVANGIFGVVRCRTSARTIRRLCARRRSSNTPPVFLPCHSPVLAGNAAQARRAKNTPYTQNENGQAD